MAILKSPNRARLRPIVGSMWHDLTTASMYIFDGSKWVLTQKLKDLVERYDRAMKGI